MIDLRAAIKFAPWMTLLPHQNQPFNCDTSRTAPCDALVVIAA
jgi:hypothetical protein